VTSKTTGPIFYLSSLSLPFNALRRAAHFRSHVYRNLFLLFSLPNEPPNANGITVHPRSHDSFYIHDETFAHTKARGLNAEFLCSCPREIHADCFSENFRAQGVKLWRWKQARAFTDRWFRLKYPGRDIFDNGKIHCTTYHVNQDRNRRFSIFHFPQVFVIPSITFLNTTNIFKI